MRQSQSTLDNLGLTASAVALSAKRLSRARLALEWMTDSFMAQYAKKNSAGFIFIPEKAFNELPTEIQLRVWINLWLMLLEKIINPEWFN